MYATGIKNMEIRVGNDGNLQSIFHNHLARFIFYHFGQLPYESGK